MIKLDNGQILNLCKNCGYEYSLELGRGADDMFCGEYCKGQWRLVLKSLNIKQDGEEKQEEST